MKARSLLFCLLLSLMLTVTFIPTIAFANDEDVAHDIYVADSTYEVDEDGEYYSALNHGRIYGLNNYNSTDECYSDYEGQRVDLYITPDSSYYIEENYVSIIDSATGEQIEEIYLSYDTDEECYYFVMPYCSELNEVEDYYIKIHVFFEIDYDDPPFTEFNEIVDDAETIGVDDYKAVDIEGMFKFKPQVSGMYAFFSTDEDGVDSVGRVLDANGSVIAVDDDSNGDYGGFKIVFNAKAGQIYYLQAIDWEQQSLFYVTLEESTIKSMEFVPKGQYTVWKSCDPEERYWPTPETQLGDKLIIKYNDGSSKVYTYGQYIEYDYEEGEEVEYVSEGFLDPLKNLLPGYLAFDISETYAPSSAHKSGEAALVKANVEYMGLKVSTTINVKFLLNHDQFYEQDGDNERYYKDMIRTAAVPASCTKAGNIEYWQCKFCNRYFKDKDGVNEIAAGSWTITGGHNWQHVKQAAGLLKNGSEYDQCTVCGAKQNSSVIPGWGKYYVKAPKTVAGKKSFTVKWGKQSKANLKKFNGYQIRYSTKKSMAKSKMVKAGKTAKLKKVSGLKGKTKYFVQVRTYTKKSGKTFYSKWSAKKTVKTK